MKVFLCAKRNSAITLLDILVVIVVLGILLAIVSRKFTIEKRKAQRIQCVNNLRQIGSLFMVWSDGHQNNYPMFTSETNGNPVDFDSGPNAWRHFRIVSHGLRPPRILFCPAESDSRRSIASNFMAFNNSNVSYFAGSPANRTDPKMLAAGDRNITNGTPLKNGILELTANQPGGWTREMHKEIGNISLADGSVQQTSRSNFQNVVTGVGTITNRLLLPILAP